MPTEETTYRAGIERRLDTLEKKIDTSASESAERDEEMLKQVRFTNGKVRKLTLALVAVAALALGMGINNSSFILSLLGL